MARMGIAKPCHSHLHVCDELTMLVRANDKLLKWLSSESDKSFTDDLSPVLQTFHTSTAATRRHPVPDGHQLWP